MTNYANTRLTCSTNFMYIRPTKPENLFFLCYLFGRRRPNCSRIRSSIWYSIASSFFLSMILSRVVLSMALGKRRNAIVNSRKTEKGDRVNRMETVNIVSLYSNRKCMSSSHGGSPQPQACTLSFLGDWKTDIPTKLRKITYKLLARYATSRKPAYIWCGVPQDSMRGRTHLCTKLTQSIWAFVLSGLKIKGVPSGAAEGEIIAGCPFMPFIPHPFSHSHSILMVSLYQ